MSLYRGVRTWLSRFPRLRSAWYLLVAIVEAAQDGSVRSRAQFERVFSSAEDPFGAGEDFGSSEGYQAALDLTDALPRAELRSALEIGCAEGHFTEQLALRVDRLLAVDFSPVALHRARLRCTSLTHVQFALQDLREDQIPGQYDLVAVMSVLECFASPFAMAAARRRIVKAIRPGGFLLVANIRGASLLEQAWWSRPFVRGGLAIDRFFAECASLKKISNSTGPWYVVSVFRKSDAT